MPSPGPPDVKPPSRFGWFEFVVGGMLCLGFPVILTAIAPVSWINLQRVEDHVHATTRTCVFFYVPYKTQQLTDVTSVSTTFKKGESHREKQGRKQRTRSESQGTIQLHGPSSGDLEGEMIAVSVSPASTKEVEAKIQAFLADPQLKELSLFTVANWKFGVIFAIPMCLLAGLFVVVSTYSILKLYWNPRKITDSNV